MRRSFVFIIFSCLHLLMLDGVVYAQDVELQFSYLEGAPCSTHANPPYLQINYINRSNCKYYFPSLLSSKTDIPRYGFWYSINAQKDSAYYASIGSRLYIDKEYENEHFVIHLEFKQEMSEVVWAFDSMPQGEGTDMERLGIGDSFSYDMHEFSASSRNDKRRPAHFLTTNASMFPISLFWRAYLHYIRITGKSPYFTNYWLRHPKRLMKSPSLVFLPANSVVTQYASLQNIQGTGIILTFTLSSPCPPDMVHSNWGDYVKLPENVCGYDLYMGYLKYEPITIDF